MSYTMKNWSIFTDDSNLFLAPELRKIRLQGEVYGNPRFDDGRIVSTSSIIKIADMNTHKELHTRSGSIYKLYAVDVNVDAEKAFPNYYDRLRMV